MRVLDFISAMAEEDAICMLEGGLGYRTILFSADPCGAVAISLRICTTTFLQPAGSVEICDHDVPTDPKNAIIPAISGAPAAIWPYKANKLDEVACFQLLCRLRIGS